MLSTPLEGILHTSSFLHDDQSEYYLLICEPSDDDELIPFQGSFLRSLRRFVFNPCIYTLPTQCTMFSLFKEQTLTGIYVRIIYAIYISYVYVRLKSIYNKWLKETSSNANILTSNCFSLKSCSIAVTN